MCRTIRSLLCLLPLLLVTSLPAQAEKRVALVIGINDYPKLKTPDDPELMQLDKAVADAETMAGVLEGLGFDVELALNADRTAFLTALDNTKRKVAPGDTVFVFYSGHGIALKGSNLLLPSDFPPVAPDAENLMRGLAIAEADIIEAVREKSAGLIVLALDACRNNPVEDFARRQARIQGRKFRSVGTMRSVGLEVRPSSGVFSIYSAGIGQFAIDGLGPDDKDPNSVFTRVFAKKLKEPGHHLADIMEDVKESVASLAATVKNPRTGAAHKQFAAYYNETQGGRIYLAGRPKAGDARLVPQAADPALAAWNASRDTKSVSVLEDFIAKFGDSFYASLAKAKLAELKKKEAEKELAVTAPPAPMTPKEVKPPAPQTPAAPAPSASDTGGGESAWVKLCQKNAETKNRKICLTYHERLDGNTGNIIVDASVRRIEGETKEQFLVNVTTAVSPDLDAGMEIRIDGGSPIALKYTTCDSAFCRAGIELTKELLQAMRRGRKIVVAVKNSAGKAVGFPVPLSGFTKAYDGPPFDYAKYQEARRSLLESIKKRQEEKAAAKIKN